MNEPIGDARLAHTLALAERDVLNRQEIMQAVREQCEVHGAPPELQAFVAQRVERALDMAAPLILQIPPLPVSAAPALQALSAEHKRVSNALLYHLVLAAIDLWGAAHGDDDAL